MLSTGRVQDYSDAVLAIIATIMVVPTMKIDESSKAEILVTGTSLFHVLTTRYRLETLTLFWLSFWTIFQVWIWHGRKFRGVSHTSVWVVYTNGFELLAASLLPFNAAQVSYSAGSTGTGSIIDDTMIWPFFVNVCFLSLGNLFFQLLATYQRNHWYSQLYLQEAIINMALSLLSFAVAFSSPMAAIVIFGIQIPVNAVFGFRLRNQNAQTAEVEVDQLSLLQFPLREPDDYNEHYKHRLETFTDGVIGIAATLIILDIRPPSPCMELTEPASCLVEWDNGCRPSIVAEYPFFECVYDDREALSKSQWLLFAYVATFGVINILWILHHHLFEHIVSAKFVDDLWTRFLNGHFCVFVALIPFSFSLVTTYAIEPATKRSHGRFDINPDPDAAKTACAFAGLILMFASLCLLGILIHHSLATETRVDTMVVLRFCIVPFVSLLTVVFNVSGASDVLLWPVVGIPLIFFSLRLLRWKLAT